MKEKYKKCKKKKIVNGEKSQKCEFSDIASVLRNMGESGEKKVRILPKAKNKSRSRIPTCGLINNQEKKNNKIKKSKK